MGFRVFGGDNDARGRNTEMKEVRRGAGDPPQTNPVSPLPALFFPFPIKFTVYQLNVKVLRAEP